MANHYCFGCKCNDCTRIWANRIFDDLASPEFAANHGSGLKSSRDIYIYISE